jgi:conjugal transfer pilus assembly protein TraV
MFRATPVGRVGQLLSPLVVGALLSGCAMLRDNVKGSFACKAPDGTCAPSSAIDDAAIAVIRDETTATAPQDAGATDADLDHGGAIHTSQRSRANVHAAMSRPFASSSVARPGTRILRVVLPAHVDRQGQLHETAAVQLTLEDGLPISLVPPRNGGPLDGAASAAQGRANEAPALLELAEQAPDAAVAEQASSPLAATTQAGHAGPVAANQAKPQVASPVDAIKADVAAALAPTARRAANFPATSE